MSFTAILRHALATPLLLIFCMAPISSWARCSSQGWNAQFPGSANTPTIVNENYPIGSVVYSRTMNLQNTGAGSYHISCDNDFYYIEGIGTESGGIYSTAIPNLGMRITWERAAPYSGSMLKQGIFHSLPSNNMTLELVKTGELTSGGSLNGSFARIYSGTSNARDLLATIFFSSGITVNVSSRPRPPTCRVSTGKIDVTMAPAPFADFKGIGSVTAAKDFSIELTCAGGEANTRLTAFITLTDATQATNRSSTLTLAQNSKARGVGIQVLRNNVPVSFGPDSGSLGNANQWNAGQVAQGQNSLKIPLSARLVQTAGSVTPGMAYGRATFTMSYQ
ncbi:fimbrial protein [Delftia acidovorans]